MSQDPKQSQDRLRAATGAAPGGAPRRTILDYLADQRVASGITAVAGKLLDPSRLLRLVTNSVRRTPRLMQCEPQSVLGAIMTSAALGLEPNTVQQQAFLIPYKKRALIDGKWTDVYECEFQVGARGFVTLAYRSERVKLVQFEAIHQGDEFAHQLGTQSFLRYAKALASRGALVGSFSYVQLTGGAETACVLPLDEIHKIRSRSESYRFLQADIAQATTDKDRAAAERKLAETPWVMWEDDMAAKSAIKKHAKQLPIAAGEGLTMAADLDDKAAEGVLNLRAMSDPDLVRAVVAGEEGAPAAIAPPTEEAFGAVTRARADNQAAVPAQRGRRQAAARDANPAHETREDRAGDQAATPGEGKAGGTSDGAPTEAELIQQLDAATSEDERDEIMDLARSCQSAEACDRLRAHRLGLPPF